MVLLATLALAAACGSDGGSGGEAADATASTTAPPATTAEEPERPGPDGSCSETVTAVNGQAVQVVVERGDLDCVEAVRIVDTYYNDPPSPPEGSGGYVRFDGWECISSSAAEAERTGHLGSCDGEKGRLVMRPAGASGEVAGGELSLTPDGIGLAEWGAPRDQVVAAVSEQLGEPTQVFENVDETSPDFDFHVQVGRYVTWDGLTLYFHRDTDGLTWYLLAAQRYDQATGGPVDTGGPDLTTPEGIGLGAPASELFATYAPLQRWECDYTTFDRTVAPAAEGDEGTLVTALDGYYFAVTGGEVSSISHAAGDERDFCY